MTFNGEGDDGSFWSSVMIIVGYLLQTFENLYIFVRTNDLVGSCVKVSCDAVSNTTPDL